MTMQMHYLEIVTPELDATCAALEKVHHVQFGKPEASLGNARTTRLPSGVTIGVRAPMNAAEMPVVRPYFLVDDLESAVNAAASAGAQIALPSMEIPGHGTIAIYFMGGAQYGLWKK